MRQLQTSIIIEARPAQVWKTLTAFEQYPDWNPFIVKLSGQPQAGAQLEAHLKIGSKPPQVFKPRVLVCKPEQEFRWLGKLFVRGLFDGEHYFQLEAMPNGHTRLLHGEHFSGLLAGPVLRMIEADTRQGFEAMNAALKGRVEVGHAGA
jgi:hypothetical protein